MYTDEEFIKLRQRARATVYYAVKTKKMKKLPCLKCGDPKSHAHHHDYTRPLDVIWLCAKHHGEEHRRVNLMTKTARESLKNSKVYPPNFFVEWGRIGGNKNKEKNGKSALIINLQKGNKVNPKHGYATPLQSKKDDAIVDP